MVEAYGQRMPLNQVGTVSAPEPRMLTVRSGTRAWSGAVDKAIRDAGLGLNPAAGRPADPHADSRADRGAPQRARQGRRTNMPSSGARRRAQRAPRRHGAAEEGREGPQDLPGRARQKSDEVQKLTDRTSSRSTTCWPTRKKRSRRSDVDCVAARHSGPGAGSPPRRHHHGWQRPLGEGARPAALAGHRRGAEAVRRVVARRGRARHSGI